MKTLIEAIQQISGIALMCAIIFGLAIIGRCVLFVITWVAGLIATI